MVINKRAQFFLLAAVIISAVVISLGISANRASVNREPGNFYDFSYEVKREAGSVLDYEIYKDIDDSTNLTEFVNLLAKDIRDKNPDANFLFIYGNNESMTIRNYGSVVATMEGESTDGSGESVISILCQKDYCQEVVTEKDTFDPNAGVITLPNVGENITVTVEGNDFDFPVSRHRQVIFIMQKGVEDESFIAVS